MIAFSEALDFLLELASQVQSIWLSIGNNLLSQPQINIIAIIREIFARKCNHIKIVLQLRNFEFTVSDSEKLLEVHIFH